MKEKKTRKERVQEATDKMQEEIENYFTSPEEMKEYLSFMNQFYNYSPRNTSLIHSQFRGAEAVGSFKFWKEKGYSVQKGEKSIQILTPNKSPHKFKNENGKWKNIKYATKEEQKKVDNGALEERKAVTYFSVGHVFDISQTNATAEDLPKIFPNKWLEGDIDNYEVFMRSYERIAKDIDVTVGNPLEELGSAKGAFYTRVDGASKGHIGLNPRNSEFQNVKTMAHELAHAKLHNGLKGLQLSSNEKEFQAEMVAYTVNDYFGIDTSEYSLGYLANWTKGKEFDDKIKLLEEIKETSSEFIEKIENNFNKEMEHENEKPSFMEKSDSKVNKEEKLHWYNKENKQVEKNEQEIEM